MFHSNMNIIREETAFGVQDWIHPTQPRYLTIEIESDCGRTSIYLSPEQYAQLRKAMNKGNIELVTQSNR